MGRYILIFGGMIGSFALIYYREMVGDIIGEAEWMRRIGGVYNVVIIIALIIFFWSLAELTGTTDFLFGPIKYMIPGFMQPTPEVF